MLNVIVKRRLINPNVNNTHTHIYIVKKTKYAIKHAQHIFMPVLNIVHRTCVSMCCTETEVYNSLFTIAKISCFLFLEINLMAQNHAFVSLK